jgi:hypothetical protein
MQKTIYADLHCHTAVSDGNMEPEEILKYAAEEKKKNGLEVIAFADHDFMHEDIADLVEYAYFFGFNLISGIELTAVYHAQDNLKVKTDILLYDPKDLKYIEEYSKGIKEMRQKWMKEMVDFLNKTYGWEIEYERVFKQSKSGYLNRRHLREAMIEQGYIKDHKEGVNYTDAQGVPSKGKDISTQEAVELGKKSGAVAGFAHPFEALRATMGDGFAFDSAKKYISEIVHNVKGMDFIEAYYSTHSENEVNFCKELAARYNLAISGGSDFHKKGERKTNGNLNKIEIDLACTGLSKDEFNEFNKLLKVN